MSDLAIQKPLTRTSELMVTPNGGRERIVQCYPNQDPHYFIDSLGNLNPIEIDRVDDTVSPNIGIGDIFLRERNVISCGIQKSDSLFKYMGLRPDFNQHLGKEQMEFTLVTLEIDGRAQPLDLSRNIPLTPTMMDLGSLIIHSTRQWTRQYVRVPGDAEDFKFVFRIHLEGLSPVFRPDLDQFWFYSKADQSFRFRYPKPSVIDPQTLMSVRYLEDDQEIFTVL